MMCSIGFDQVTPWRKKALSSSKKERSMIFPQPSCCCGSAIVIVRHSQDRGRRKN
jgi:hypothetical protein